jgi:hypothetical protein
MMLFHSRAGEVKMRALPGQRLAVVRPEFQQLKSIAVLIKPVSGVIP